MGVEWKLCKIRPVDSELQEGDEFDSHPYDPQELDAMLVGNTEGPLSKFLNDYRERSDDYSVQVMSSEEVRRFASVLAAHDRGTNASLQTVLKLSGHMIDESIQQDFYDGLAEEVDKLRQFITSAASEGIEVRLEVC